MPQVNRSRKRKVEDGVQDKCIPPHSESVNLPDSFLPKLKAIELAYYLKIPNEYAWFYQFCRELNAEDPLGAIEDVTGLRLVGPFELLHGTFTAVIAGQFAQCYRHFYDPPEFVTLLVGLEQLHFGCFRDLPLQYPCAIVGFDPPNSGKMKIYTTDLFAFLKSLLDVDSPKSCLILEKLDSFLATHHISTINVVSELRRRRSKFVCPTLNSMGLFVELREGDVGYRPLSVTYDKLSSMLQAAVGAGKDVQLEKLESIDEIITYAQFACDEGDYGQSIELGLSMLAFKPKGLPDEKSALLNSRIKHLLSVGYELAGRPEFAKVIRDHMDDRRLHPRTMSQQD